MFWKFLLYFVSLRLGCCFGLYRRCSFLDDGWVDGFIFAVLFVPVLLLAVCVIVWVGLQLFLLRLLKTLWVACFWGVTFLSFVLLGIVLILS